MSLSSALTGRFFTTATWDIPKGCVGSYVHEVLNIKPQSKECTKRCLFVCLFFLLTQFDIWITILWNWSNADYWLLFFQFHPPVLYHASRKTFLIKNMGKDVHTCPYMLLRFYLLLSTWCFFHCARGTENFCVLASVLTLLDLSLVSFSLSRSVFLLEPHILHPSTKPEGNEAFCKCRKPCT